jgi:hypothetical protein
VNGDKQDNRIENLTIIPFGEHSTYHNRRRKATEGKKEGK